MKPRSQLSVDVKYCVCLEPPESSFVVVLSLKLFVVFAEVCITRGLLFWVVSHRTGELS